MSDKKLTPKQELFCRFYVKNGHNGTKAAIDAGYSKSTANEIATQNLGRLKLQSYIRQLEEPVLEKLKVTEEWVSSKLKGFADAKITDYMEIKNNKIVLKDFSKLTDVQISAIEVIKETKNGIEIRLVDRRACVVDLGKHLGMFKESVEGNFNHNHNFTHRVYVVPAFCDNNVSNADNNG